MPTQILWACPPECLRRHAADAMANEDHRPWSDRADHCAQRLGEPVNCELAISRWLGPPKARKVPDHHSKAVDERMFGVPPGRRVQTPAVGQDECRTVRRAKGLHVQDRAVRCGDQAGFPALLAWIVAFQRA